jgi:P27 family predicted phage terminase small subunit
MSKPALSIETHRIRGTRPTRAKPEQPSNVSAGRPRMPKHLCPAAVAVWKDTVRIMRRRGILSADCAPTLAVFAEVSATWELAKADVLARGQIIEETRTKKNGETYTVEAVNPSCFLQSEAEKKLLSLTKALGLSPDARQKVKTVKEKPELVPANNSFSDRFANRGKND